jgi:hypothetical protein
MQICTRSLARTPKHARKSPKAPFILLEHFRRNREDFRRGFAWTFRRNKPRVVVLPIVPPDPEPMDGYGSRYPSAHWDMGRPMSSTPLDLI